MVYFKQSRVIYLNAPCLINSKLKYLRISIVFILSLLNFVMANCEDWTERLPRTNSNTRDSGALRCEWPEFTIFARLILFPWLAKTEIVFGCSKPLVHVLGDVGGSGSRPMWGKKTVQTPKRKAHHQNCDPNHSSILMLRKNQLV